MEKKRNRSVNHPIVEPSPEKQPMMDLRAAAAAAVAAVAAAMKKEEDAKDSNEAKDTSIRLPSGRSIFAR